MPKLIDSRPKYRKHKATGQAVVTLSGKDFYLGPYGTKVSHREYDRLTGEWMVADGPTAPTAMRFNSCLIISSFMVNLFQRPLMAATGGAVSMIASTISHYGQGSIHPTDPATKIAA
jgi:hypothetical protein